MEYTFSAYVANANLPSSAVLQVYPYWTGGVHDAAYGPTIEYTIGLDYGWTRVICRAEADYFDRSGLSFVVKASPITANGQGFYLDAAQIEAKNYSTPFYDGSRVPITCRIANTLLAEQGTISLWASADDLDHAAGKAKYLFADSASDGNFEGYVLEGGSAFFEVAGVAGTGMTGVATGWHHWAFTWSDANNKREIYYDGSPLYSGAYAEQALGANLYIGSDYAGTDQTQWNGYLDDFVAHRRFLDSDEIAGIYNTPYAHSL
jgi:hypothetical protein